MALVFAGPARASLGSRPKPAEADYAEIPQSLEVDVADIAERFVTCFAAVA
jgi:hypothetical protein